MKNHQQEIKLSSKELSEKIYAAWLGKVIGVRLGAPIENWTHQQIKDTYGKITDYVVDYGVFAADDDTNGPLFFVRSLLEDDENISVEKMGYNLLNYVSNGHGFFWWGGKGISTEETAYRNLEEGILAPNSGSCAKNGKDIAEQIGGQIFSDCWGYISGGNPELAKKLASKMSSVTHGLAGIDGGIFVAVCISLAMNNNDIKEVIKEALTYLDKDSDYVKVVQDIMDYFYSGKSEDECLEYILDKYSYSKYPGVCHIIPNTAIMIMAMMYGENDFSKTMCLLATAGWDTDCNLGNVGSIMGALVGISNIDSKWIRPINDVILSSSSMGSLNIDTISNSTKLFTEIACKLNNIDYIKDGLFDFKFKYGTQGFYTPNNRYSESNLEVCDNKLKVIINQGFEDKIGKITKKSYYLASDIYDARYQPSFSPTVYPNETITFKLENPRDLDIDVAIYVMTKDDNVYQNEFVKLNSSEISYKIDIPKTETILEYGLLLKYNTRIMHEYFYINNVNVSKDYDSEIDFKNIWVEDFGLDFGGLPWKEVALCSSDKNNCVVNEDGVIVNDDFLIFMDARSIVKEWTYIFKSLHGSIKLCFDVEGLVKYKAIELHDENVSVYLRNENDEKKITLNQKIHLVEGENMLNVKRKNDLIVVGINGKKFEIKDEILKGTNGSLGIKVDNNSSVLIQSCKCKAL